MNYTIDTDLWDLRQRINILEVNSDKHNARLNKLEDVRDDKADPSKLESNKDYALDWYINQYQNMCKEYNEVKIELDDKQKVLKLAIEQRDQYLDQIINQNSMIEALENDLRDSKKTNQKLKAFIKNHEDKILELEDKVKYYEAMSPEQYKIQYMQLKDMGSEIFLRNKFQLENEKLTEENLKLKKEIVKLKIAAKGQPHLVIKVTGDE